MAISEVLGKTSAWQIRDFPEALREEIVKQAKLADESVPEFMTRNILALRDAGWPRFPMPPTERPSGVSLADQERVAAMVVSVTERASTMPKGIRAGILRIVKQAMDQVDQKSPARRQARLAAPVDRSLQTDLQDAAG